MEEWKEYRLGDIIAIKSGFAYKGDMIGYGENVLLGMGCVSFKERFLMSGARAYAGDCADRYCAYSGDIVLATRQQSDNLPILGMPAIIPNELREKRIIIGANLYRVDNESDFSNEYIYWLLKTPLYVNHIRSCQSGTTVRMITKANIEDFRFKAPGRKERDRISHFLKSLDDKIEVNRRINDNLEQQAQALFKSWFVDFEPFRDQPFVESELGMIPKGWRVGTLFDVAEIFDKQRKPLSGKEREGMKRLYPYYGATSCMDYVDNYLFDGIYTLIGEDGSVAKEDGSPYMQYVWGKFWVNNHAHILQGKNGFSTEMIYVLLSTTNIQHLVTGAVQAKLSQANMQKIVLAIPPTNVLNQVRPVIDSMYETRRERENESRRLAELRDTLLPRLMSGELSVDGLKGQFAVSPGRCPGSNEHVSNKTAL